MNKHLFLAAAGMLVLAGCSSGGGSSSAGTQVQLSATPSAINSAPNIAGSKTFSNSSGDSITLNKAYLVISSVTLETSCGTFSTMLENIFDSVFPVANAHTTSTPTSTGEPYVIDILAADDTAMSVGSVSPPAADYCGATIDLLAADADANNLPTSTDMVGRSVFIEASYTLSDGVTSGSFTINTSSALLPRDLLIFPSITLSASHLNDSAMLAINYDTWFNTVNLTTLETDNAQLTLLLNNITNSIHQL